MADLPVRYGLVGFGAWGQFHARCIARTPGATLVAIAARSAETRAEASRLYPDARIVERYEDLCAADDLDAVDVVLPSSLHFAAASCALAQGKHLLLEKPMCLEIGQCRELVGLAHDKGLRLSVVHELRLSSLWGKMKDLIEEGAIGEPRYLMMELSRRPYRTGSGGWRYDPAQVGSWVLEEPIHFFDLARWYFAGAGEPVAVRAQAGTNRNEPGLNDHFTATMTFPNGGFAVICQTLAAFGHHQSMKVVGTSGALWARWDGAMDRTEHPSFSLRVFDGETVTDQTPEKITGEIFELQDHLAMFTGAIAEGTPLSTTGEDGLWSVAMCLAADRSIAEGREVEIAGVVGGV